MTGLFLSNNRLKALPESFGNLQALTRLSLTNNLLEALPESFGNLHALIGLFLEYNQLITLPESFGNLQALARLSLNGNSTLRGIPMEMLQLSSNCEIDLTGCGLSIGTLERLREIMRNPDYSGPLISYSIADRRLRIEEKSIEESLNSLYAIIDRSPKEFAELEKTPELRSWLSRLSDTADYKAGGEMKKAFAERIIVYLNQANDDTAFRTVFYQIIQEASKTCGDRVTLSVLHLSIAHQLATIDLKDIKKLADFLIKGPWTIEMLEKIARNKILTLPFFDEIEVYLGYPIKLKQKLQIPIDVQEMLYFSCSALKPKDLEEAENSVLEERKNLQVRLEFLVSHAKWLEALSANYPREYKALVDKKTKAAEQEGVDYTILAEEHKKDLIELTDIALPRL